MIASLTSEVEFEPEGVAMEGYASPACRACIAIPVCNEQKTLHACLDAFGEQRGLDGSPLTKDSYEVLLLLNNCTDHSRAAVQAWQTQNPDTVVWFAEREFAQGEAHAGNARRLAMDTAWHRLRHNAGHAVTAIMTTDADSVVAPDWVARNLAALEAGADAVGGHIRLPDADLAALPPLVRRCYEQDRRYAALIAELEDLLDPQKGDASPRHLDHFGSSLACTPETYALVGGLPALPALEDEAFVDRLRRAELCLRHDPKVVVTTSARLQGRATVGLAGQLRLWSELREEQDHAVQSGAYLAHRFRVLRALRTAFSDNSLGGLTVFDADQRSAISQAMKESETLPDFLSAADCDALISQTFCGDLQQPVRDAIQALHREILNARSPIPLKHGDAVHRPVRIGEQLPLASF